MRLKDKAAIVTGSGRGLGKAMALRMAEEGAKIVVTDIVIEGCLEVKEEIEKAGGQAIAVKCDVTNREDVVALMDETIKAFGQIDILVNNAGITRDKGFLKMTDDLWDAVLNTNLKSMFICTQEAVRHMVDNNYGRIVCISSICAEEGNFGQANYGSAKAGVFGFIRTVTKEVAKKGITINAVAPGFMITDMTKDLPAEVLQSFTNRIPVGRGGQPVEVANAVVFLASDEAAYITGQVLNVNGGMYM